ncbi:MAG: type IV toxin-antitoxin system AbiEi family antitoxin domain-containing protein [Candidatus Omnitrophota bacterium]
MHRRTPILATIRQLRKQVFTTFELASASGKSTSAVTQGLSYLVEAGILIKIYRGVWAEAKKGEISLYAAIPYLFPRQRAYVSFISALHLYGIIEQIPQVVTVASLAHTKTMRTSLGTVAVHRITPALFCGFSWYKGDGSFLIAEPEKALVDSVYLSVCKKRQFGHFPELRFPRGFDFQKAHAWTAKIPNAHARAAVYKKIDVLRATNGWREK